jgi:integrase/recombinase XerD
MKNLVTIATETIVAGVKNQEVKGNLTLYMVKASQRGLSESTVGHYIENLAWLAENANLSDPVKVWNTIDGQKRWKPGTKQCYGSAYKNYAKTMKIPIPEDLDFTKWELTDRLPDYVPTENDVTQLISGCRQKAATFLQLLYECGLRSGEAWKLRWENFDFERKILTLNTEDCEKKGIPRQFKISDKLVAMLNMLKLKNETNPQVWNTGPGSLDSFRSSLVSKRKQLARKLQNPNLLKIKLHTLRHFYACKLYHQTKDILLVMSKLGHRNIQSTMVYTRLVEWDQPDLWIVKRPLTSQEEDQLIESGFDYVRFDDRLGTPIYRKRK